MALIKCKECSSNVSTEARACPQCGAKVRQKTSKATLFIAGLFGVAIFSAILSTENQKPGRQAAEAAKSPTLTAAETAKKEAETKQYAAAVAAAATIKQAVRDPDSLHFDSMRVSEDASVICAEYRAKNGFGGMNREFIVFVKGTSHQDAGTWNKRCKAPMPDQLYAVQ